ncbi:MAG: hypothetical protein R3Y64_10130, partial [Peptostreptococcaceae bacterium]
MSMFNKNNNEYLNLNSSANYVIDRFNDKITEFKDKKDFIKLYVLNYKNRVLYFNEAQFEDIHLVVVNDDLFKVLQVVRYKNNISVKEIVDMVKKIDIEYSDLITLDKICSSNIFSATEYSDMYVDKNNMYNKSDLKTQLELNRITINLVKFIKYELYRKELDFYKKDLTPKFKILPNLRNISVITETFISKNIINDLAEDIVYNVNNSSQSLTINDYLNDISDNDIFLNHEYEKLLLDEKFYTYYKQSNQLKKIKDYVKTKFIG